jgi:hypothetical protein
MGQYPIQGSDAPELLIAAETWISSGSDEPFLGLGKKPNKLPYIRPTRKMDQDPIQGCDAPSCLMLQKPGPDEPLLGLGKKPNKLYLIFNDF